MERAMLQRENKTTTKSSSFFKPTIQKKLSIGSANDSYEVEADNMANKVMRMTEPSQQNVSQTGSLVQRKCTACEQEEKIQKKSLVENITPLIQRSSNSESGGQAPNHVESQINSSRGGGSSMDNGTKNFMESRFGTDFSDVKIHTGSQAVQMSRELNAQAFTVGNDIYFNEGKYSPNSDSGKHLLAHELTHTVQQSGGIGKKIQKQTSRRSCRASNVENFSIQNFTNRSITIPSGCSGNVTFYTRWLPFCNGPGAMGCTGSEEYTVRVTNGSRVRTYNLRSVGAHCGDAEQPEPVQSRTISLRSGTNNLRISVDRLNCEGIRMSFRMEVIVR
ncbi:eCIS core domain-containing protein [Flavobacterium sp. HNIBRBA15423]|uniref:eCIS core domain-containing protein n=1 Tax=Flavobacterium sp. HNIBRBA15423 TaxID=3458683 RepID=UPI004044AE54